MKLHEERLKATIFESYINTRTETYRKHTAHGNEGS